MQTLKPLRTTDGINKGKRGLGKAWLAKDKATVSFCSIAF